MSTRSPLVREIASESGVPIGATRRRRAPIYASVEIGDEIKREHYAAVAAAIHYAAEIAKKAKRSTRHEVSGDKETSAPAKAKTDGEKENLATSAVRSGRTTFLQRPMRTPRRARGHSSRKARRAAPTSCFMGAISNN
ncbi:MAG: EscU/YscU/HrcU family type III secretion system export apparatus switch protein [Parvularculaceae bacterium]